MKPASQWFIHILITHTQTHHDHHSTNQVPCLLPQGPSPQRSKAAHAEGRPQDQHLLQAWKILTLHLAIDLSTCAWSGCSRRRWWPCAPHTGTPSPRLFREHCLGVEVVAVLLLPRWWSACLGTGWSLARCWLGPQWWEGGWCFSASCSKKFKVVTTCGRHGTPSLYASSDCWGFTTASAQQSAIYSAVVRVWSKWVENNWQKCTEWTRAS